MGFGHGKRRRGRRIRPFAHATDSRSFRVAGGETATGRGGRPLSSPRLGRRGWRPFQARPASTTSGHHEREGLRRARPAHRAPGARPGRPRRVDAVWPSAARSWRATCFADQTVVFSTSRIRLGAAGLPPRLGGLRRRRLGNLRLRKRLEAARWCGPLRGTRSLKVASPTAARRPVDHAEAKSCAAGPAALVVKKGSTARRICFSGRPNMPGPRCRTRRASHRGPCLRPENAPPPPREGDQAAQSSSSAPPGRQCRASACVDAEVQHGGFSKPAPVRPGQRRSARGPLGDGRGVQVRARGAPAQPRKGWSSHLSAIHDAPGRKRLLAVGTGEQGRLTMSAPRLLDVVSGVQPPPRCASGCPALSKAPSHDPSLSDSGRCDHGEQGLLKSCALNALRQAGPKTASSLFLVFPAARLVARALVGERR